MAHRHGDFCFHMSPCFLLYHLIQVMGRDIVHAFLALYLIGVSQILSTLLVQLVSLLSHYLTRPSQTKNAVQTAVEEK